MKNIFTFETMWSTKLITLIYWFALILVLVSGLATIFGGKDTSTFNFIAGVGIILVGAVSVRLWCEVFIVIFKIHENLKAIADKIGSGSLSAPAAK